MSKFEIKNHVILEINKHPNADKLEVAKLENINYQFVIPKDVYKVGDNVLYFPIDSVLPNSLLEKMDLVGKLSGNQHNRIKTIKLRGEISQGLICFEKDVCDMPLTENDDIASLLGIEKYEPPEIITKQGNLIRLPQDIYVYDLENAENYPQILSMMLDEKVVVTEKLEGSHFAISYDGKKVHVCQRRHEIEETLAGEHTWIKVAREQNLFDIIENIFFYICKIGEINTVTLRGEIIGNGIQGNIYNLPNHDVFMFELEVDGLPCSSSFLFEMAEKFKFKVVPVIFSDMKLSEILFTYKSFNESNPGKALRDFSNGQSFLYPTLREGVVIKLVEEREDFKFGRIVLKQRSPEYLSKEK